MNKKDVEFIIGKFLNEDNKPYYNLITFHLINGMSIVSPINTTKLCKGKRFLLIVEEFVKNSNKSKYFVEWFIPYSEISMVVLR